MMLKRNIGILMGFVTICVIVGVVILKSSPISSGLSHTKHIGSELQEQGIETQADYTKFQEIRSQIKQTKSISDSDLEWMLALMKKPSSHPEIVITRVTGVLNLLEIVNASQKRSIFDAVVPLLADHSNTDTYRFVPQAAANVLGHLGDVKAIPYLQPLLSDPDPNIRKGAEHALEEIHQATTTAGATS